MAISDFCINPVSSCGTITGPENAVFGILSYYITCSGTNPFQPPLTNILSLNNYLNLTMQAIQTSVSPQCYGQMEAFLGDISTFSMGIEGLIACPLIYSTWSDFMYSGVCDYAFNGVFNIWVVQMIETCILFAAMCVGSASYSAFVGFEEDRATNGALNDWLVDQQSFEPITSVKLTAEEAAARLQTVQQSHLSKHLSLHHAAGLDSSKGDISSDDGTSSEITKPGISGDVETGLATSNPLLVRVSSQTNIINEAEITSISGSTR
jgi:hypothetical protein